MSDSKDIIQNFIRFHSSNTFNLSNFKQFIHRKPSLFFSITSTGSQFQSRNYICHLFIKEVRNLISSVRKLYRLVAALYMIT